jgi:hypothetical protein
MKEFKSDNEFDKLFQDTLKGDSISPSDNVWESINSRLDNESKKPKFIFWLSLFIGIVLIGTVSFLALEKSTEKETTPSADKIAITTSNSNPSKKKKENTTTQPIAETTSKKESNNTTRENNNNENSISTKENNSTVSQPKNNEEEKSLHKNKKIPHQENATPFEIKEKNNTPLATKISDNKTKVESTTAEKPLVSTTTTVTNNKIKKENEIKTEQAYTEKATASSDKIKKEKEVEKEKVKEAEIEKNSVQNKITESSLVKKQDEKSKEENKTIAADSSTKKVIATETVKTSSTISVTPKDSLIAKDSVKSKTDSVAAKTHIPNDPPQVNPIIIPKPADPFPIATVYGFYSPDYFYSKPTSTQSNYNPSTEKQALRFSTGVKVEYRPVRMIGIQLGCAYSEIKQEKVESELHFSKYITSPYSIYSSLGEMQVDASVMKDGFFMAAPVDSFRFKTTYSQSVKFLNVPLNIKLNLLKNKFNVYIDAGLNTQIAIKQKSTLNLIKENFTNTIEYNDIKVNRLNYSVLLGLGLEYKVYKRFGIFVEPNIRYGLTNMSKVAGITNKPIILGGYGGVCIYL